VAPGEHDPDEVLEITGDGIRLGQLLKLAGLVSTGGEAKSALAEGLVTVNGEVDRRRGAQLADGDVVACGGRAVRVATTG
jgi:ribosome-associated protein